MPDLTPIQLEDGTTIYIQATPTTTPEPTAQSTPELDFLTPIPTDNRDRALNPKQTLKQGAQAIQSTIRGYTLHLIKSFQDLATAQVKEITLEFGVNAGGLSGIPYIATGNADCNVKVTVTCTFPTDKTDPAE
ncbi:MAG: CU044_2847 family protein [Spirulinaceae cyanobacterium]